MNNKDYISELANRTGRSQEDTQRMVNTVIEAMGDHFQEDDSILVPNFGTFEVKKKLERIMVNPSTGQRMLIPPKLVLNFKPNSGWKERVKSGGTE
ncbi:MAG: HU family DNA-binding protein [Prevotella sp.]|jgi:DNA-binding protein HU-beta/integration host factor subunit alpha|nr:HU family DNA-binding protein [Prevotella sp.]MEE3445485.1 HU family DNA-binding protein [Prevotella sp.]